MLRKTIRRRPEVKSPEMMMLLSGILAQTHADAAAPIVDTSRSLVLSGTVKGTYHGGRDELDLTTFRAKGKFGPLGIVAAKGAIQVAATGLTGAATLSGQRGKLYTDLSTLGAGGLVFYTITGGTGKFAGLSGSGEETVDTTPSKGKGPAHGSFVITYVNPT